MKKLLMLTTDLPNVATVNGLTLEQLNSLVPKQSLPEGMILPPGVETIAVRDGKALLDVSVYTSDTITNENWSVATNGVIVVPAPWKQGFFILKSKAAVPSDAVHAPIDSCKE